MSREPVVLPTSLFIFNNLKACGFWLTEWYKDAPNETRQQMLRDIFDLHRSGKFESAKHRLINLSNEEEKIPKLFTGIEKYILKF